MLRADLGLRFLEPRYTCAVCGRQVDPDDCEVIASTDDPECRTSVYGLELHVDVVPGEVLVICAQCRAR